jgi:hypothetical protein
MSAAQFVVVMSFELVDGVMIGSHQCITPGRLPEAEARLAALRAEWESELDCEVRMHRQLLTS